MSCRLIRLAYFERDCEDTELFDACRLITISDFPIYGSSRSAIFALSMDAIEYLSILKRLDRPKKRLRCSVSFNQQVVLSTLRPSIVHFLLAVRGRGFQQNAKVQAHVKVDASCHPVLG